MPECSRWITPFWKQAFVVLGVAINRSQISLAVGFTARLLPQLKRPDSIMPIDDNLGSWIAAVVGLTLGFGNLSVAAIMGKYGRKLANIVSITISLIGWIWISLATSVTSILVARSLQGLSIGMIISLAPILIGECTCPQNRAAFISFMMFICALQMLVVHTLGSYLSWQMAALVLAVISFIDLLIIIYNPESPSWLADKGKYDECKKVFHWLRGDDEDDELREMIDASIMRRERESTITSETRKKTVKEKVTIGKEIIRRREFFLPIFIMFHIYTMAQWSGMHVLVAYTEDFFYHIAGPDVNFSIHILILDFMRIISNFLAIYLAKKLKRRVLVASTLGLNICVLLIITVYSYTKINNLLPRDHPLIGAALADLLIFSITIGPFTVSSVISGEIFPLEFRSFSGGFSCIFSSLNYFLVSKTFPACLKSWGLHGITLMYATVVGYCTIMTLLFLPETKDRTLQSIENDFKGNKNKMTAQEEDTTKTLI